MKRNVSLLLIIFLIVSTSIWAKRRGPRSVVPIIHRGIKYSVIHWGYQIGSKQNGGYIEARSIKTGKKIWGLYLYKIIYTKKLEKDLQDRFITSMRLDKKNGKLIVKSERNNYYWLYLHNKKVVHIIKSR